MNRELWHPFGVLGRVSFASGGLRSASTTGYFRATLRVAQHDPLADAGGTDDLSLLYCRCSPRWASGPDASHADSFFGQTNRLSEGFVAVNMTAD